MTREFENICKILYSERCPGDLSEETMKLFYDHTFEIGKGAQKSAKKMVDFTNNCPILNPFKIREKVEIGEEKMTCSPNVSAGCHAKFFGIISEIENKFCQVIAETDSHRIKRKQLKTLPKNYATHKFNCTKTVIWYNLYFLFFYSLAVSSHWMAGNLYLTILTFTNYFYIGAPVMPLAVNIHERKFKSSHSMFWARILCDIPALAKYRYI